MNQNHLQKFETLPISKLILANMIPAVVSMLMSLLYNLADTFFIGQTHNAYMVAAASLATPAFTVFMSVGLVFGIGGTSYISRLIGMGRAKEAKHVSAFAFWTGGVIGILGMLAMWIFNQEINTLLGASSATASYITQYLSIIALGVPFQVFSSSFSNILRAEGKAKQAMNGMIIGNITNIILDPIFILVFKLDIRGAAIATVIGNVCSALYYLYQLAPKRSVLSLSIKDYKAGNKVAVNVLSIGIPASLNSFMMTVSVIVVNNYMMKFGDMAVAGMGVATKIGMMLAFVLIGVATGVQPIFGYFYGAKDRVKFIKTLKFTMCIAVTLSIMMTVLVAIFSEPLVRGFLSDPSAYDYGVAFTRILVYSGPVLGILFVFNNAIQGMGMGLQALVISISRQGLIYIPLVILFYHLFDSPTVLMVAQPLADYATTILASLLFVYVFKKYLPKEKAYN